MESPHLYRGRVTYVFEGNVYDVVVDTGFFVTVRVPVKLRGLSLPSFRSSSAEDRRLVRAAKDVAMGTLLDKWVFLETFKEESRSSKMWLADIYLQASSSSPELEKEILGTPMVDFSAYMNLLKESSFDTRGVDLTYDQGVPRGREASSRGH